MTHKLDVLRMLYEERDRLERLRIVLESSRTSTYDGVDKDLRMIREHIASLQPLAVREAGGSVEE